MSENATNKAAGPPAVGERWKDFEEAIMILVWATLSAGMALLDGELKALNYTPDGVPVLTIQKPGATVRVGIVARVVAREDEAE